MIRVTIRSRKGGITGFDCQGHAGFSDYGKDIVCAAVSVLTTTCANALESVAGVKPVVKAKEGNMFLALPHGGSHDAQVILQTLRQGLRDIAEEYPRYLLLNEL